MNAMAGRIKLLKERVNQSMGAYVFKQPQRLYETYLQRLDRAQQTLTQQGRQYLVSWRQQTQLTTQRLQAQSPLKRVQQAQLTILRDHERLKTEMQRYVKNQQEHVAQLTSGLDYLSPLKIMGRGYSYVTQDRHIVRSTHDLQTGAATIHLSDGTANAEIKNITTEDQHD